MKFIKNKKRGKYAFFIVLLLTTLFILSPFVSANPIVIPEIDGLFQSGLYGSGMPVYLKTAEVEINCYSEAIEGYGRYEIVNLNASILECQIFFSHFYFYDDYWWAYNNGETIDSVKIDDVSVDFVYNCTYNPCYNMSSEDCFEERYNLISFNVTLGSLDTIILEIEWSYEANPMKNIYLTGYTIFSEGWNRSIEYEEVIFKFHSNDYYRWNKIRTYVSNQSFHDYATHLYNSECSPTQYDWGCKSVYHHLEFLRDSCNKTELEDHCGVLSYTYSDTNISEDCYIIVVNPFLDTGNIIKTILGIDIGISALFSVVLVSALYKKRRVLQEKSLKSSRRNENIDSGNCYICNQLSSTKCPKCGKNICSGHIKVRIGAFSRLRAHCHVCDNKSFIIYVFGRIFVVFGGIGGLLLLVLAFLFRF